LASYKPEFADYRIIQPENLADTTIPEDDEYPGANESAPERKDDLDVDDTNVEVEMVDTSAEPMATQQQERQPEPQQSQPKEQPAPKQAKPRQPQPQQKQKPKQPAQRPSQPKPQEAERPIMKITKQKEKPADLVQTTLKKTKDGPAVVKPSGKTSATPDKDKQISLHVSRAAARASPLTNVQGAGFVSLRTSSGGSLGSLTQYAMDWNSADLGEVTSGNPNPALHPGSPSVLAQKMRAARAAFDEADKTAEVRLLRLLFTSAKHTHISSPRDSG